MGEVIDLTSRKLSASFSNITIYKSGFKYGIVCDLSKIDLYRSHNLTLESYIKPISSLLKGAQCFDLCSNLKIIEFSFKNEEDRQFNLSKKITLNDKEIELHKSYLFDDPIAFLQLKKFPGDIVGDDLKKQLADPLKLYGSFLYFTHKQRSDLGGVYENKACAIFKINDSCKNNMTCLPSRIFVEKTYVNLEWKYKYNYY